MQYNELIGFKLNSRVKASLENIAYYPFHLHSNCIEIICVLNGSIVISDSALNHNLSYGDVYIFNANDPHKIVSDDIKSIVLTIHIDREYYKQFFKELKRSYFVCDSFFHQGTYPVETKYLRFLLAKIYTLYSLPNASDFLTEEITKDLLKLLLDQFQFYTYRRAENNSYNIILRQNINNVNHGFERIYKIIDYITEHYKEKLTLEEIAKNQYLSTSHLSRYIKASSGMTFSELLSITRCEEAERLLSYSNRLVDQIALDVGFANRKHLSTQFKRWFDKTPTEYRKSVLSDLANDTKINIQPFDYDFAKVIINAYLDGY
jgi:AraC-like DNA-binding protein